MLEFPEVLTIAEQLKESVVGRKVDKVLPPSKVHKFCWYNGEPEEYDAAIKGSEIMDAKGFGLFVEMTFDNGYKLCFNEGVNARLVPYAPMPKNHQLLVTLNDDLELVFTVAMYGGIILHADDFDNEYYKKSKQAVSPFSPEFEAYFHKLLAESKPSMSAKAFLATEQRFPGIGNGVSQDILFAAGIHPKRKLATFHDLEKDDLRNSIITVLHDMVENGGRDTEKNIFGQPGNYKVNLSKNTIASGCPKCGGSIVKETYLGGSVYYCPVCQPLAKG